jgi:hypothetical protein
MLNPHLPTEILDHIVDLLHDTNDALRNCCLVSKSWVPRTRKHLFASIWFPSVESLRSWMETFPDPSTSPARYVKALSLDFEAPDAEVGGWIRGFSRVEHLEVGCQGLSTDTSATPLVPFHGFSPFIKSLRVIVLALPPSALFNLILSFPLLEDLAVIVHREVSVDSSDGLEEDEITTQPSSQPMFTGSLELYLERGMRLFTRRLLSLPGGIRFRKLTLTCFSEEDLSLTATLVKECSHTLESFDISWQLSGTSSRHLRPHR